MYTQCCNINEAGGIAYGLSIHILVKTIFYISKQPRRHRRLQTYVGTWAGLGYTAFDAQLRKAHFVSTLCAIRTSVRA